MKKYKYLFLLAGIFAIFAIFATANIVLKSGTQKKEIHSGTKQQKESARLKKEQDQYMKKTTETDVDRAPVFQESDTFQDEGDTEKFQNSNTVDQI